MTSSPGVTFMAIDPDDARWYSSGRGGKVHAVRHGRSRVATRDDMMVAVEASKAQPKDIDTHSPHSASDDFPLDWLYVPMVRAELERMGFDSVYAWDILENDEVPVLVTWGHVKVEEGRMRIKVSELRQFIRESLNEVDLDPANNPGRPDDAFDYLGMHPDPAWAMAHPASGGGDAGGASGDSEAEDAELGDALGPELEAPEG